MFSASHINKEPLAPTDAAVNTEFHLAIQKHLDGKSTTNEFALTVAQLILDKVNPNPKNHAGERPLDTAIRHQAVGILQTLLVFDAVTLGHTTEEITATLRAIKAIPKAAGTDSSAQKYNASLSACIRFAEEKILPKANRSVLFAPSNSTPALQETPTTPSLKR